MTQPRLVRYRHYQAEIILLCVRWYSRYSLSYRDLEEMMAERGLSVDHTTIYRWVQHYAPLLEKKCRAKLNPTNASWRVDETYIKVKGQWMYLYRAVDSAGATVEFMLSPTRDAVSVKRFFRKAVRARHTVAPGVINVDRNPAYPKPCLPESCTQAQEKGHPTRPLRVAAHQLALIRFPCYLIEQDHRFIKRRVNPGLGFWSLDTAWRTIQGYAGSRAMNQLRKGQVKGTTRGDILSQVRFVSAAFGLTA